jgi:cell division septation protein DedD
MALMLGSLLYLFAMKIAFQTSRDLAGAVISVAVAAIVLLALEHRHDAHSE